MERARGGEIDELRERIAELEHNVREWAQVARAMEKVARSANTGTQRKNRESHALNSYKGSSSKIEGAKEVNQNITPKCAKLLSDLEGHVALDAGCGEGYYLPLFKHFVVGLDVSKNEIMQAKKQAGNKTTYVIGDVRFLPFQDKTFDYVLCLETIEHLYRRDVEKALKEFERVTEGKIQISTPNITLTQGLLRRIFFPDKLFDKNPMSRMAINSPHRHRSTWTAKHLKNHGFKVHGCLGCVTTQRIGSKLVVDLYDFIAWNTPAFSGTLIGIKTINSGTRATRLH